jgi:peptide/nickel transport system substrate-binding protein
MHTDKHRFFLFFCGDQRSSASSLTTPAKAIRLVLALLLLLAFLPSCRPIRQPMGTLVYGISTQPNTLNPLTAPDIVSRWAIELVFDGLVDVNERLEIVPALAQSWQVSPDGLTWSFDLRRGVRWHDGTPFTASDVQFTYQAIFDPAAKSTLPRSDYQAIARLETPDDTTVRFILKEPDASFLSKLTLGIVPQHLLAGQDLSSADFNRYPVGTGPFVLQEWLSGQHLRFTANPAYFGGRPGLESIVWRIVPDSTALLMQLPTGEVDGALVDEPEDVARLTAEGKLKAYGVPGGNVQISLQLANDIFQDVRVRRALALALDRPGMIAGLLGGQGTLSAGDILPASWAYNPQAADLYPYDPAQARALLAQAGWQPGADGILTKDSRRLAFTLATDAGDHLRQGIALTVQQQWRAIGVAVDLDFVERNTFVLEYVLKGQFQAALLQSSVRVDPDLSRRFHSRSIQSGQNFLNYHNPALDDLLDQALRVTTPAERAPLYRQAQLILAQDVPQINLFYPTAYYVFQADIQGIKPSAMSVFWNAQVWAR